MTFGNGSNFGGKAPFPGCNTSTEERMELYDGLPREVRDILKYTYVNITLSHYNTRVHTPKQVADMMTKSQMEATVGTYGHLHPDVIEKVTVTLD